MKLLITLACALAVATATFIPPKDTIKTTTGSQGARDRRHLVTPVVYTPAVSAVHTPVVAHQAYAYPYVAHSVHPAVYRARRHVVTYNPVAYHAAVHHTPVVAHTTYPQVAAYSHPHAAYLVRKRRDVVDYHGAVHTPVVHTHTHAYPQVAHASYTYPHVVQDTAYLYRKRRGIVAPVVYQTPVLTPTYHAYPTTYGHYTHYY